MVRSSDWGHMARALLVGLAVFAFSGGALAQWACRIEERGQNDDNAHLGNAPQSYMRRNASRSGVSGEQITAGPRSNSPSGIAIVCSADASVT